MIYLATRKYKCKDCIHFVESEDSKSTGKCSIDNKIRPCNNVTKYTFCPELPANIKS